MRGATIIRDGIDFDVQFDIDAEGDIEIVRISVNGSKTMYELLSGIPGFLEKIEAELLEKVLQSEAEDAASYKMDCMN